MSGGVRDSPPLMVIVSRPMLGFNSHFDNSQLGLTLIQKLVATMDHAKLNLKTLLAWLAVEANPFNLLPGHLSRRRPLDLVLELVNKDFALN